MPEERRVATEVQIALQPQAGSDPAAALTAAAAKLARQSLEMLVQQAGQPLAGKIVPPPPNLQAGMAQIAVADMVLTLKLSTPLPPGTPVRIDVQQTPGGQPAVVVQPQTSAAPQPSHQRRQCPMLLPRPRRSRRRSRRCNHRFPSQRRKRRSRSRLGRRCRCRLRRLLSSPRRSHARRRPPRNRSLQPR